MTSGDGIAALTAENAALPKHVQASVPEDHHNSSKPSASDGQAQWNACA